MSQASSNTTEDDRLLNIKEVERDTGLSRATINRLIKANQIPSVKVGKRRLFRNSEFQVWMARLKSDGDFRARLKIDYTEDDRFEDECMNMRVATRLSLTCDHGQSEDVRAANRVIFNLPIRFDE
jgi:excisionase family DNA binding protein